MTKNLQEGRQEGRRKKGGRREGKNERRERRNANLKLKFVVYPPPPRFCILP